MARARDRIHRRSARVLVGAVVTAVALASTGCAGLGLGRGGDVAEDVSPLQKSLYEQAMAAGGKVSIFIGTASNSEIDEMNDLFNEKFPGIEVSYVSGTGNDVSERFLTERRSGLSNADVLMLAGMAAFERINEEGLLENFEPEDAGLFKQDPRTYMDGIVYSFSSLYNGVCYNPKNVTEQDAAKLRTYRGWTDPTWRGRSAIVNVDGFGYRFGMTQWVYGDPQLGKPWLADLAALRPTVYSSANVAAPQTIAGEYDVVFNVMTLYGVRAYRQGAPLRCVAGEYAPFYTFGSALPKDAPNDAAGKLYMNWLYSEDGQTAVQETLSWTARREGFTRPVIDADWWDNNPRDARLVEESLVSENYTDLRRTFNAEMGAAQKN
jgi:iron(III) transport system substrate-binding protein